MNEQKEQTEETEANSKGWWVFPALFVATVIALLIWCTRAERYQVVEHNGRYAVKTGGGRIYGDYQTCEEAQELAAAFAKPTDPAERKRERDAEKARQKLPWKPITCDMPPSR